MGIFWIRFLTAHFRIKKCFVHRDFLDTFFKSKRKENSSKKRKHWYMNVGVQSAQKLGGPQISSASQICKPADLLNLLDVRTFRKFGNVRICDVRTQSFF